MSDPTAIAPDEQALIDLERQHVVQNYGRGEHTLRAARGEGVYLYDFAGKRYLDFISGIGVNALGHKHPRLNAAIKEQLDVLVHCSNLYYHPYQGPVAQKLAAMSGLPRAFFCNSGAEAVEAALKIGKGYGRSKDAGKYEIVALHNSFAGRTLGAIAVTGQPKYREPFAPLMPGVRYIEINDTAALEAVVNRNTAAVFFEPVLGEGGIVEVDAAFGAKARELAARHDALLIYDEIQCGLGRTGEFFTFQHWGADFTPDVLTAAKPLAAGLPLGVVMCNEKAAAVFGAGMHGSTFGGGALACRAALEFLSMLPALLPRVREVGGYFHERLNALAAKYDFVTRTRGKGLMVGLELTIEGKWVVPQAQRKGLLMNCTAGNILRFLPPYIVEREHVDEAVAVLDAVFEAGPPADA